MATATFLIPDMLSLGKGQLLHTPTGAQTPITGALLSGVDVTVTNFVNAPQLLDVSLIDKIRVELWGVASDTNGVTVALYGWPEGGGGHAIATVTAITSVFAQVFSADPAHSSLHSSFGSGSTWTGCDTYAIGTAWGVSTPIVVPGANSDDPGYFTLDFTHTQYKWIALVPVTVVGTSVGAIFMPLGLKSSHVHPRFTA